MSKIFKLAILVLGLSLFCVGAAIADPPPPVEIPIDINIGEVLYLDAKVRNISDDAIAAVSFSTAGVTTAAPWQVSNQYIDIEYTANTAIWGVRLITGNKAVWPGLVGNKIGSGDAGTPADPVNWNDGDEILSYAGLISPTEAAKADSEENPSLRAALGWQVYTNKVAKPANPTDASFGGNPYSSVWAYLSDKANNVANADGTRKKKADGVTDFLSGDETVKTGTTADGKIIFSYSLIAYGGIGQALAQHPEVLSSKAADDTDGDGYYDVAVYLTARFANTNYADPANPVDFVLPGGSYSAKLYVEMLLE